MRITTMMYMMMMNYDCQGPQSFAAPLHVDCYEILQDAYKPRKVTLSALYDTLTGYCSPTRDKHQPNSLDLDYGLPSGPFEVDMVNLNNEFALASPSQVDECIEEMVQELFRISRKSKKPKNGNIPQTSFANGNGEKISPSKIYADMPWAKHYLPRTDEMRKRRIDWKKLYMNLDLLGKGIGEGNFKPNVRMYLENRCRIWSVCTRLLGECSVREPKKNQVAETNKRKSGNKSNKPTDKIIKGAVSSLMPLLTFPADSKTTYASVNLINKMNDMEKAEPVIRVYWNASKELAGIGVHDPDKNTTKTIGSEVLFHSSEDAQIPKDDWLVAIFITTKEVSGENNPKLMQRKAVGIRFVFLYDNLFNSVNLKEIYEFSSPKMSTLLFPSAVHGLLESPWKSWFFCSKIWKRCLLLLSLASGCPILRLLMKPKSFSPTPGLQTFSGEDRYLLSTKSGLLTL
ncbi:hypothetical protein V3481_003298 [Fusarium oxysporum f. sp. vasinfectum]